MIPLIRFANRAVKENNLQPETKVISLSVI